MPQYFEINPAFTQVSSFNHSQSSRFLPLNSRPLTKMEIPDLNTQKPANDESSFEKCTKSLQLITNCFNSQVTFVKFKNSEQCHVLLYDMRNLYKQYFGSIFHRHFQTTEIKASKQMPVEVAYKIDQNLGYGGVLLHERGLVREQALVLFLIEILPRLILKFGFSSLTPYGIKIFERMHSGWHYQMERHHPRFYFPMIYIDLENWIFWNDLQNSGLLKYYNINALPISDEKVILQCNHHRQEFMINRIADHILEPLVTKDRNFFSIEKKFISRTQLYNFLIILARSGSNAGRLPKICNQHSAIDHSIEHYSGKIESKETNIQQLKSQFTSQSDPIGLAKEQIQAILQSNLTSQQKHEEMAIVTKNIKQVIQIELDNKVKLKQDVLNDAEKKIRELDESISKLKITILDNMGIF